MGACEEIRSTDGGSAPSPKLSAYPDSKKRLIPAASGIGIKNARYSDGSWVPIDPYVVTRVHFPVLLHERECILSIQATVVSGSGHGSKLELIGQEEDSLFTLAAVVAEPGDSWIRMGADETSPLIEPIAEPRKLPYRALDENGYYAEWTSVGGCIQQVQVAYRPEPGC